MKLWKFCPGYVKIRIMGEYPERLVNRCISEGIAFSDCERCENGLRACVVPSDIKRIRAANRGCGCRVLILSRHGVQKIIKPLKRDRVFLSALAVSLIAVIWLSTRLWNISVYSPVIPETEILSALKESGVGIGTARSGILCGELSRRLGMDGRIVNAKVTLRGVKLKVSITASGGSMGISKDTDPANVYAEKDCVISFISAASGRAEVEAGQAVKSGDILIRGDLSDAAPGYAVRAEGLIYGEVLYRASATAPRQKQARVRTGESSAVVSAELFGKELIFGLPEGDHELVLKEGRRLDSCLLPVAFRVYECFGLTWGTEEDSEEGTRKRAQLMAQEKLKGLIPEEAKIRSVGTRFTINGDGSVTAIITVTTIEKIGITRSF